MEIRPRIVLLLFIILACLNWLYVLWASAQPDIIINAWFVLTPLTGFFYITFTLIASIGLYQKKTFGLALAYGVILFGTLSVSLSYLLSFRHNAWIEAMILPLFIINLCIVCYIAWNRDYFRF